MSFNLIPHETPIWARGGHLQTLSAKFLPSPKLNTQGQLFKTTTVDGDVLASPFYEGTSPFIFILAHGLAGDSDSTYNHRLSRTFLRNNHSVYIMNHRNCGASFGLSKNPYCGGRSEDLARIIYDLREKFPTKKIILVGFSMSGNAALLLSSYSFPLLPLFGKDAFSEKKELLKLSTPDQIIAVNPPVDLMSTALKFKEPINAIYEKYFLKTLNSFVDQLHKKKLTQKKDIKAKTLIEFDEYYTAPLLGYSSAKDFYENCSAGKYLENSQIPTVILTAQDDPIIDFDDLKKIKLPPSINLIAEKTGGHMGFIHKENTPLGDKRWMDYAIYEIFKVLF